MDKIVSIRNKVFGHINNKLIFPLSLLVIFIFPILLDNNYILHILILLGVYVVLGVSLNVVAGVTGELDLGHAAFFGIGAYASSLFVINIFDNFWIGMILAGLISLLFGLILGIPSLRIRGDYLAIVTLGFNEIIRYVLLNMQSITNGPMGIKGIPSPTIFGYTLNTKQQMFYLIWILVIITCVVMNRMSNSRFGRTLVAIREDEIAATSLGINTGKYKIWSFAITAAFAGIGGSFFAHYMNFINPNNFTSNESILILCMITVGGRGSIIGSVIGVAILFLLPELLRPIADYRMLIYGILLVLMMVFKPKGFWPEKRVPSKITKLIRR
ncbi:branched-chain amino acid ABC transporter permease [Sedimentibacter sp.]|uniref:branched-chain amino acid ABC transporter permease n=1 Tax=Sedimentibacter sp. TaxID=1960295 RepID=UPI0028A15AE9|nr:branched-chain amino acid ABC transporter permease [Sedimentibacter sp.]